MPLPLGLCSDDIPSSALARRAFAGLIDHLREADRRYPNLRHVLVKRDPSVPDWTYEVPCVVPGRVGWSGEYEVLACWSDAPKPWLGFVFGETLESGAAIRFEQLATQIVRWQQHLKRAPGHLTMPFVYWVKQLYDLAWSGHGVVRADILRRRLRLIVCHTDSRASCWYAFLEPSLFEASALAMECIIEGAAAADATDRAVMRYFDAKWYDRVTHGALYADLLRNRSRRDATLKSRKRAGRWQYQLGSVCELYPQYSALLRTAAAAPVA